MDFKIKNALYIKLKDVHSVNADKALLNKKNPNAKVLRLNLIDKTRESKEVLYALLDVATEEEIIRNRLNTKNNNPSVKKESKKKSTRKKSTSRKKAPVKKENPVKENKAPVKKDDPDLENKKPVDNKDSTRENKEKGPQEKKSGDTKKN